MIVLALSSGTSVDAIDVAAVRFGREDGTLVLTPLGFAEHPWNEDVATRLRAMLPPSPTSIGEVTRLHTLVGRELAAAAVRAVRELDISPDLVVSHGQTVFHWVERSHAEGTLQLGEPAWIAEATGVPVLSNVRMRDIAAGGHGAPLASTFDAYWLAGLAEARGTSRLATVNLGGIANVSLWDGGAFRSFDTGPANCLVDDVVRRETGGVEAYDRGGERAARGRVSEALLPHLLDDPYFSLPAPKSTGREYFDLAWVDAALAAHGPVPTDDLVATLTALTARTVVDQVDRADLLIASGGGVRNRALMAALRGRLAPGQVVASDDLGVEASAKEAYLFALLGYLGAHGLPGTVVTDASGRTTTGAEGPRVLGDLTPGAGAWSLPTGAEVAPVERLVVRR